MQMEIDNELYVKLVTIGVIPAENDATRSYNVGTSDYSEKVIQPWSVWIDWNLNPWDADIVKRICRHKDGEDEYVKYEKIIHICRERLRQLNTKAINVKDEVKLD